MINKNKTPPRRKKHKFSKLDLYVTFSVLYTAIYSIAVLVIFAFNNVEPTTLTICVYGFFGGEVTIAGLIKIFNIREEYKETKNKKQEMEEKSDEELY